MSEQIYYVRLKPMDTYLIRDNPGKGGVIWIDGYKQPFTKSELAEIMNGALYHVINEEWECGGGFYEPREWINPLIELVAVEDDKNV